MITRRHFVCGSAGVLAGCRTGWLPSWDADASPFGLGIASGDPAHDGAILWTRITPSPVRLLAAEPIPVRWIVAKDPAMREVVRSGAATATPANAYCVHADADGLSPATAYYYRFEAAGARSPVGRTRTLPRPGRPTDHFRIALTSCQEYSAGYFTAYRDLSEANPHVVIHNGDYIYEAPGGRVRPYPITGEAVSLDDYRALYARYRQDPDLRRAHALFPWIVIWDDHEVANDWGPDHFLPSRYNRPMSLAAHRRRIQAARRAFLEHMPLRASLSLHGGDQRVLYGRNVVGDLIEINRLDVRSYRATPVCNDGLALQFRECPDIYDRDRSLLGPDQERWLLGTFGSSGCAWSCLAQTTVMSPFDREPGRGRRYETESWDNYAASRTRLIDHVRNSRVRNPMSLGGNIHAFYAGGVTDRFGAARCAEPALTEIVTTSISAPGGADERYDDVNGRRAENPCIDYFENRHRGYTLVDVTRAELRATFRVVDATRPDGAISSLARCTVDSGRIGTQMSR